MNIENIMSLADQLQELGFGNLSSQLLKRICLKPKSFSLATAIEKDGIRADFSFFISKAEASDTYILQYFEGILPSDLLLPETPVNGVDVVALNKQMATINWRDAFDMDAKKAWDATEKTTWANERAIEAVITDLQSLDTTSEGKRMADALRLKFWSANNCSPLLENIAVLRNKAQIVQRFYFFERQAPITANEAFRFLQNRQLEKTMLAQSKARESNDKSDEVNDGHSGSGLLKKKRRGRKGKDYKTR